MAWGRITNFILVLSILTLIAADTSKDIKKLKKDVRKLKKKDISIFSGIESLTLKDEEFNETLINLSIESGAAKMNVNKLKQKDFKFNETIKSVISAETDFMEVVRSLFGPKVWEKNSKKFHIILCRHFSYIFLTSEHFQKFLNTFLDFLPCFCGHQKVYAF